MSDDGGFVKFIVTLGDGSRHPIEVDKLTLERGDSIAFVLAVEYQRAGSIPPGDILSVRRATAED